MMTPAFTAAPHNAALRRLAALTELDAVAVQALESAIAASVGDRPRAELMTEGKEIAAPLLVVEGWAAHVRLLPDGRRQFLHFLLPGELIGSRLYSRPLAASRHRSRRLDLASPGDRRRGRDAEGRRQCD